MPLAAAAAQHLGDAVGTAWSTFGTDVTQVGVLRSALGAITLRCEGWGGTHLWVCNSCIVVVLPRGPPRLLTAAPAAVDEEEEARQRRRWRGDRLPPSAASDGDEPGGGRPTRRSRQATTRSRWTSLPRRRRCNWRTDGDDEVRQHRGGGGDRDRSTRGGGGGTSGRCVSTGRGRRRPPSIAVVVEREEEPAGDEREFVEGAGAVPAGVSLSSERSDGGGGGRASRSPRAVLFVPHRRRAQWRANERMYSPGGRGYFVCKDRFEETARRTSMSLSDSSAEVWSMDEEDSVDPYFGLHAEN